MATSQQRNERADRTEENLRNEHSEHTSIYEEIPFGVWMCGRDGGLCYASESFLALLGMSMEEAQGFGWTRRIENPESVERWKECVRDERDWDDEHQIRDSEGKVRTMLARGHAVRDESGSAERWIGIHVDITERKRAEQRVKDARNFAEGIIATVPDPLLVLDADHRVTTVNPAFCRQFKNEKEDSEGKLLQELGNGQWNIPAVHKLLEEVLQENASFEGYEMEHDFPTIGPKIMLVNGRRLQIEGGATEMILLAIRDITEERQAADRLRVVQEAQTIEHERQRFAKRLHDHIQQLLVAGKMQISMAQRHVSDEPTQGKLKTAQELLEEAIRASRDLAVELVPPVLSESGLRAALHWLADWMQEKHELAVQIEAAPDLVVEDQEISLLVFDVIRELLLNVVKHADVDSATLEVLRIDGDLQVMVSDCGKGFDLEEQTTEGGPVAGFGLSALRSRVRSLHGSLALKSARGKGTKVTVRVPLQP